MKDDVKKYIYGALIVFLVGVTIWVSIVFINACGFSLNCARAARLALPETTPIPTMIPAKMPAMEMQAPPAAEVEACSVAAADLVGAWVEAGSPETDPFTFTDVNDTVCEATFADVQPLFIQSNLWYAGSLACVSCHSVELAVSPAQLDLSSYEGILSGSRRTDEAPKGTDILGGGKWEGSLLYQFMAETQVEIPGHDAALLSTLVVNAGIPSAEATPEP